MASSVVTAKECDDCPNLLENLGFAVDSLLTNVRPLVFAFCNEHIEMKWNCRHAWDVAEIVILQIKSEVFPREDSNVSRDVMCSQALKVCPDRARNGTTIVSGKFSCQTCFSLFDMILKLVVTPVEKINRAFESIMCNREQENCIKNFLPIIYINDKLRDSHVAKNARKSVCEQLGCI
ncbi:unnamed protein product [Auanema sp. JU1783]|nr:unnamed protein product [Auanema sp. JU1783]